MSALDASLQHHFVVLPAFSNNLVVSYPVDLPGIDASYVSCPIAGRDIQDEIELV